MFRPRKATKEEIRQLRAYYIKHLHITNEELGWIDDASIAVFDDYLIRGCRGVKMMITVSCEGVIELLIFNKKGGALSLFCSG
jgi:hypothetical protein